jgi:capsular exopolysaccharide synthesis family protein
MINFAELLLKPRAVAEHTAKPNSENTLSVSGFARITVEQVAPGPEARIVFQTDPNGPGADRFRYIRMRLRELWRKTNLRSILITSALPDDGKSTVALNLATVLAERGNRKVLVIEADLHHPALSERLGIPQQTGISELLEEAGDQIPQIRRLNPLGWYLLSAGHTTGNPTELLQSERLPALMRKLAPHFDWILIDSPPTLPLADAISLSQCCDATLLVARADTTPREAIEDTIRLLGPEKVVGIVLSGAIGVNQLYANYHRYYSPR